METKFSRGLYLVGKIPQKCRKLWKKNIKGEGLFEKIKQYQGKEYIFLGDLDDLFFDPKNFNVLVNNIDTSCCFLIFAFPILKNPLERLFKELSPGLYLFDSQHLLKPYFTPSKLGWVYQLLASQEKKDFLKNLQK